DEIDALGGTRGNDYSRSSEKDQTLNQLLSEMDGFSKTSGIVVIAATNRVDVLDPALIRPGRFDRQFNVGLPDLEARCEILKVHSKNKKMNKNINFLQLAQRTPGFSGAQLAAVLNEASILAVRNNKEMITIYELDEAIERLSMGIARKNKKITLQEKNTTAYHEAGHAVVEMKSSTNSKKVRIITIVPRGNALGYMWATPEEEYFFSSEKQLLEDITCSLGGVVAEEIFCNSRTDGVYLDLKSATSKAYNMVCHSGMSSLGYINFERCSEQTRYQVDQEVKKIIDKCYMKAKEILEKNKDLVEKITNSLLKKNTLNQEEIYELNVK
ncbi:AAA family ATPase, partial ['Fragaria x ananassa' phyllody phytoplasma]